MRDVSIREVIGGLPNLTKRIERLMRLIAKMRVLSYESHKEN